MVDRQMRDNSTWGIGLSNHTQLNRNDPYIYTSLHWHRVQYHSKTLSGLCTSLSSLCQGSASKTGGRRGRISSSWGSHLVICPFLILWFICRLMMMMSFPFRISTGFLSVGYLGPLLQSCTCGSEKREGIWFQGQRGAPMSSDTKITYGKKKHTFF